MGVSIHTVFIGDGEYPMILDTLAMNTGGARFQAVPEYETGVVSDFGWTVSFFGLD